MMQIEILERKDIDANGIWIAHTLEDKLKTRHVVRGASMYIMYARGRDARRWRIMHEFKL